MSIYFCSDLFLGGANAVSFCTLLSAKLFIIIMSENTCCNISTKVQSYEGGSVSISCPYESQDQNNLKYICRGNQSSSCLQQALITSNNTQNTQFSLTDDKVSRKFTVTITSLTQKDSGLYLCGVKRNTGLDVFSVMLGHTGVVQTHSGLLETTPRFNCH
uniref:Immunoglobulin V-set domain-containing protein n=1 Tax=Anabas testudineus TaxID=64144 RepID=A0A3Q1J763_ANATE